MQKEKLTDFDLQIKSMLEDAAEEVPSRVWDAVSARIEGPKVVTLWWKRAAIGFAMAAAIASTVLFINRPPKAVDAPSSIVAELTEEEVAIPSIEDQISASETLLAAENGGGVTKRTSSFVPGELSAPEQFFSGEEQAEEEVEVTEESIAVAEDKPADSVQEMEEEWTDPFAALSDEDDFAAPKNRLSFSMQGNVMNNDRKESAPILRAPGLNTVTKTGVTDKSQSTYGVPLTLGLGVRYHFNDRISIGSGIGYTLLTRTFTGIYNEVDASGQVVKSINSEVYNQIHYIGIPVNLYYNVLENGGTKFYVYGGGTVEKGIINKYRIYSTPSSIYFSEKVPGLQYSANAGLGVEFALGKHFGLYLDPSVHYYFDCGQPTSVRTQRPYMFNLEAGVRFNL